MNTAIYIRVSSKPQEKNNSLEEQLATCQAYAKQNGMKVAAIITDVQSAYAEKDRPGVEQLLKMAREGALDAIVMRKASRFSRNFGQSETIREELMSYGVAIHYTDAGELPDTAAGRFMHRVNASVHQFYVEEWAETSRANRETAARSGKWPGGGSPPFGLTRGAEGQLVIDELEAAIIRRAYQLYLDENKSLGEIAAMFTRERIETKRGANRWYASGIRRLLFGRYVLGELLYKDVVVPCPAIVSEDEYYQAVGKAEAARRCNDGATKHDYLLSGGRLRCSCGATMGGRRMTRPGSSRAYFYYSCNARGRRWLNHCAEPYLRLEEAETAVWGKVVDLFSSGELRGIVADLMSERANKTGEITARQSTLLKAAAAKRRQVSMLFDVFTGESPIVSEEARRRIRELSAEIQGLEDEAQRLALMITQAQANETAAAEIDALAQQVKRFVERGGGSLRREIIDALGVICQVAYEGERRCIAVDFFLRGGSQSLPRLGNHGIITPV